MVRVKASPYKSLDEVDYSHPACVVWFFGQIPSKRIGLNGINGGSPNYANGSTNGHHSLAPTNNSSSTSINSTGGNYSNANNSSLSERFNRKDKRTNKVEKNETGNATTNSNNNASRGKLAHPLSAYGEVPTLTDIQVLMTEAILSENGSASFDAISDYVSKRWKNIKRRDGSNYTGDCRRAIQVNLRQIPQYSLFKRDKPRGEGYWTVCRTLEESTETSRDRLNEKNEAKMKQAQNSDDDNEEPTEPVKSEGKNNNNSNNTIHTDSPNMGTHVGDSPKEESEYNTDEAPDFDKMDAENDDNRGERNMTELQEVICECINDNGGSCHFDLIVHHVSKNWSRAKSINSDSKPAILSALTDSKRLFKRDTKRTGWWMINTDRSAVSKREESSRARATRPRRGMDNNNNTINSATNNSNNNNNNNNNPLRTESTESLEVNESEEDEEEEEEEDPSNSNNNNSNSNASSNGRKSDPPMTQLQILIIEAIDMNGGAATFEQIHDHVSPYFETLKRRDGTPYTSECRRAVQASLSNNPTTKPFFKKESRRGQVVWELAKRSKDFLAIYRKKKEAGEVDRISDIKEEIEEDDEENQEENEDEPTKEDEEEEEEDVQEQPEEQPEEEEDEEEVAVNNANKQPNSDNNNKNTSSTTAVSTTSSNNNNNNSNAGMMSNDEDEEEEEIKDEDEEMDEVEDSDSEKHKESPPASSAPIRSEKQFYGNRLKRAKQIAMMSLQSGGKRQLRDTTTSNAAPVETKVDKETRSRKRRK